MDLSRATTVSLGSQIARLLSTLLSGVIVARTLGPSGKGTYSLFVLTYAFVVLISNFGVPVYVASTIGKRRYSPEALLGNSLLLVASASVLVAGVTLGLKTWFKEGVSLAPFLVLLAAVVPIGLLREHLAGLLHGLNRIGRLAVVHTVGHVVTLSLLALFLLRQLDLWTALYCWMAGEAVSVVVALSLALSLARPEISISPAVLKESLRFGAAVCVASLIGMASLRFDVYVVAYFLDSSAVGLYTVAATVSSLIMYLPSAMAVALLPRFASSDPDEAYRLVSRACRVALLWGGVCGVLLFVAGGIAIRIVYGHLFSGSTIAMRILLPGAVVYGLAHITTAYFNAFIGRPSINTALAALSLAIGILLDIVLIPTLGISGAALASSVAYLASMSVALLVFAKVSGRSAVPLLSVGRQDVIEVRSFVSRNVRALFRLNERI